MSRDQDPGPVGQGVIVGILVGLLLAMALAACGNMVELTILMIQGR